MSKRTLHWIRGFDGLRAFAILGIVFYHMIPRTVPGGFLGVTLFFTIMGYLLVYNEKPVILGEKRGFSIPGFYEKKILRLYPSLIITVFLSILCLVILPVHYTKGTLSELTSVFLGYNNWWQILKNGSYFTRITSASPFTHLWYLGLTIQYYLIWPFIIILLAKLRQKKGTLSERALLIIVSVLCAVSALEMTILYKPKSDPSRIYYGTDTRAFSLFMGMIVALLPSDFTEWLSDRLDRKSWLRYILAVILFAAMLVMYFLVDGTSPATYRGLMFLFNVLAALLLLLILLSDDTLGRLLEAKPIVWIGQKSYIIYLVMYPVIFFVSRLLKKDGTWMNCVISIVLIGILTCGIDIFDRYLQRKLGSVIVLTTPQDKQKKHARPSRFGGKKANAAKAKRRKAAANRSTANRIWTKIQLLAAAIAKNITASYRNVIVTMLVAAMLLSGGQSLYIHIVHPKNDSVILEEQIEKNKQLLAEQNAAKDTGENTEDSASGEDSTASTPAEDMSITAVGDSVMLGAADQLQNTIPNIYIDAEVGRQVQNTNDVLDTLDTNGVLGHTVILHLGTNGIFNQTTGQAVIDRLGSDRNIYWVNAYGQGITWANDVNATIMALCDANDNVTYVDWAAQAMAHPEWFYSDGIHLNPDGAAAYCDLIRQAVGR